jgi:hypothetical protein
MSKSVFTKALELVLSELSRSESAMKLGRGNTLASTSHGRSAPGLKGLPDRALLEAWAARKGRKSCIHLPF